MSSDVRLPHASLLGEADGEAEINQFDFALIVHHNVRGLNVTVKYRILSHVKGFDSLRNAPQEVPAGGDTQD